MYRYLLYWISFECNYIEPSNVYPNDQQHFRLHKTNEIKDYFILEVKERELMSK